MIHFDNDTVVQLADAVDRDGLDAHAATLFALAEQGSDRGVTRVLADVMLSAQEPYVARLRAFTLLGTAVVHRRPVSPVRHRHLVGEAAHSA